MPSGYSGRYKSKFFNFISRQASRFGEQSGRTFRHLQVAATWSIQALIYPVFALLKRAVENSGRQLQGRSPQPKLELPPSQPEASSGCDTPIQQILKEVQTLPSQPNLPSNPLGLLANWGFRFNNPPTLYQTQIRGIATQLSNRNLVLVTANNEILDILTPAQQQILSNRIIAEFDSYWHNPSLQESSETALQPEIDRLLAKLTGGTPEDLTLLPPSSEDESLELPPEDSAGVLAVIDRVFASLESNSIVPELQERSKQVVTFLENQLNVFVYGADRINIAPSNELEKRSPKIQALILAALNYFFGDGDSKKLRPTPTKSLPTTNSQKQRLPLLPQTSAFKQEVTEDPWLTADDLFGASLTATNSTSPSTTQTPALPSSTYGNIPVEKLVNRYNEFLKPQQTNSSLVQQKKETRSLTVNQQSKTTNQLTTVVPDSSVSNQLTTVVPESSLQTNDSKRDRDWIETEPTSVSYEKHPLERILELLDRAMLVLEEILTQIFRLLQKFIRGD